MSKKQLTDTVETPKEHDKIAEALSKVCELIMEEAEIDPKFIPNDVIGDISKAVHNQSDKPERKVKP